MTATQTDTQPHDDRGISESSDPRRRNAPWQLTIYFNGKKRRTYHRTLTLARKAKASAQKTTRLAGTGAHSYDRRSHTEYEIAKQLVGKASLVDVAKFFAAHNADGAADAIATVTEAIAAFIATKDGLDRSERTVGDYESRLGLFAVAFGDRLVASLGRNEILDWLLALPGMARTKRNTLGAVRTFMRHAERRGWIIADPCRKIDRDSDLPTVKKSRVGILTIPEAHGFIRTIEANFPQFLHWALVKYFAGVRAAESHRFRGEWIDVEQKRIAIPGWFVDGAGKQQPGSKTRDDWIIDGIAPDFWAWMAKYPPPTGQLASPANRRWKAIKKTLRDLPDPARIAQWPANALRHSFATYDLSAHRDQNATALKLRHQSARKLWSNYLAALIPAGQAAAYFNIKPAK